MINLNGRCLQRIVRKVDLRVALWAFIMFFSLDLDRSNLSQANSDNFLSDLNMNTNDFNLGNTLFRAGDDTFVTQLYPDCLVAMFSNRGVAKSAR